MSYLEWIFLGLGLSMDAAAVSLCQGLAIGKIKPCHCLLAGAYFGVFQALMPVVGYSLGRTFSSMLSQYAHWIAFLLLLLIGANVLRESCSKAPRRTALSFRPAVMMPLAVATSIDAMAVGVSFSFFMSWHQLMVAALIIGGITFGVAALAEYLGSLFGSEKGYLAERMGGIVLIVIAIKILLQGLGHWPFG